MDNFVERAKILMARLDAFTSMCPDNIGEEHSELVAEIYLHESLEDYRDCILEAQTLLHESGITHLYRASVRKEFPSPRQFYRLLELAVQDREQGRGTE